MEEKNANKQNMTMSNKKIKVLISDQYDNNDKNDKNASLKNISGETTLFNLKKLAELILPHKTHEINTENRISLFYENREIDVNNENVTIDDLFPNTKEVILIVKRLQVVSDQKKYEADDPGASSVVSASSKNSKNEKQILLKASRPMSIPEFSTCNLHDKEDLKYFCENCKSSLCFRCTITDTHKNHMIYLKKDYHTKHIESINAKLTKLNEDCQKNKMINPESKEEFLKTIDKDFDSLSTNLQEIKANYVDFYKDYFASTEAKANISKEEINSLIDESNEMSRNYQPQKEKFADSLEKFQQMDSKILSLSKKYKKNKEASKLLDILHKDYETKLNSLYHQMEKVKLQPFDEKNMTKYQEFEGKDNQETLRKNYMEEFLKFSDSFSDSVSLPLPLTKKILNYKFSTGIFEYIKINDKFSFKFFDYSRYLSVGDFLFTSGGIQGDKDIANTYLISTKDRSVVELKPMKRRRSQHSLVLFVQTEPKLNLIFAISGNNNPCLEIYNIAKDKWTTFKALSKNRCNSNILFVDDNKFLYIFGGSDGDKCMNNSFEKLNLSNLFKDYENYESNSFSNFENNFVCGEYILGADSEKDSMRSINLNFSGYGIIPIESESFLVLGGYNIENYQGEEHSPSTDEIRKFVFDKEKKSLKIFKNDIKDCCLGTKTCFYSQDFVRVNDQTLAQFDAAGSLLIFNRQTNEFQTLKPK